MKLRTGWAIVLMIILVVGGVVIGAYRGWTDERAPVNETYKGLESMLQTRIESAYNVLAVAKRYPGPETDEAYQKVEADLKQLENASASLSEKAKANDALAQDASALLSALKNLSAVQQDSRDKMYVESYLPQMLSQSEAKTEGAVYNQAAKEFNSRMRGTFSGMIARLLGIKPAEEFQAK